MLWHHQCLQKNLNGHRCVVRRLVWAEPSKRSCFSNSGDNRLNMFPPLGVLSGLLSLFTKTRSCVQCLDIHGEHYIALSPQHFITGSSDLKMAIMELFFKNDGSHRNLLLYSDYRAFCFWVLDQKWGMLPSCPLRFI